ncbi:MAG: helix-hairpin-helix domain-containing protein [Tannerellaceae bacterium]|nr:helix-hairpin-helix domain-containing protein [Tannerellaceae bacterium]
MEYVEEMAAEIEDEERTEALYNELSYRSEHPSDLNRVTAEELQTLPFLSDNQIEAILSYRKRYGKMATVYELKNIEELDFRSIELLLPFVYISKKTAEKRPLTVDNFVNYGNNELQIRYDQCFQQKQGYRSQADSLLAAFPNRQYLGEPFYHSLRYSYAFDQRLQFGMVAEKDAGEAFANKYNKGYDFYSFHFVLKDAGWLSTLAVGDYRMSFGQGLVVSNEFTPGRNAIVAQAERRTYGFRRHFSTNESDFFRGIAATAHWGNTDVSLFYSYRKLDATADSFSVSSIKTDGLHRLMRDWEKRALLPMQTYGGNIRYATPNLCFGFTALSYSFGDYRIMPDDKPYNLFYFRGNSNLNMSLDYLLKNRFLKFYGETAISANKAPATLNALQLTPVSYLSFLLLYRYYDVKYQAWFGNAFAQNTMVQNEQGLYLGLQFTPFAYWKVSTYADFFRFPWLRYGVDAPSAGKEYMVQLDYTQMENASFYLRYKCKQREKNQTLPGGKPSVLPYEQHRLRLQLQYGIQALHFKTSVDGILYNEKNKQSKGFMPAQHIGWHPEKLPFRADLSAAYFRTDDYNTRLSTYEKSILYAFHTPQMYGKGVRLSATLRWDAPNRFSLFAKLSCTHYTDRSTTGTGLEEIDGNTKTDLSLLLRRKF